MSLADLAAVGSFVSGVAVLVSLIYLGLQVRQAKLHQQAAIRTARADRTAGIYTQLAQADMVTAVVKGAWGLPGLTETELWQFILLCRGIFVSYEDAFYQHREGLLNDAAFRSFVKTTTLTLAAPGMRAQWLSVRINFAGDFVQFIDGLAAGPLADVNVLADWQENLARVYALAGKSK